MKRPVILLHRLLTGLSILLLGGSLVFYLTRWHVLPAEIGMHFGPDGAFDVIAGKAYGFYPHIVGGLLIGGLAAACRFIGRMKAGLSITQEGERRFKAQLTLTLDALSLLFSLFFSNWSRSVSLQKPLDPNVMGGLVWLMLGAAFIGVTVQSITCMRHRVKKETLAPSGTRHRVCRLAAWLFTGIALLLLCVVWERIPTEHALDPDYAGLAWFANFGSFLDKRLLLVPHAVDITLLTLLEILSVRAGKAQKTALVTMTDSFKLLCGIFFFLWNMALVMEFPSPSSPCACSRSCVC